MKILAFIFFLALICINNIFSQKIENITVIYGTKLIKRDIKKERKNVSKNVNERINNIYNSASNVDFILQYSKGKSIFKKKVTMPSDKNKINLIEIMAGKNVVFYNNLLKKELLGFKSAYGNDFIIKYDSISWRIINETKMINNYNAYKATYNLTIKTARRTFTKKVIAWYTPSIPLSLGPKNFRGLPGLILEIQIGKLMFYAKKIIFDGVENFSIPKINKKIISEKEFNEISINISKNRMGK